MVNEKPELFISFCIKNRRNNIDLMKDHKTKIHNRGVYIIRCNHYFICNIRFSILKLKLDSKLYNKEIDFYVNLFFSILIRIFT